MALTEPIGGVWAMKSGDFQPTNFASTQAGIQAALDYAGVLGEVYIGPGTYTGITNLTMYAKCTLRGAGPLATTLTRSASATGDCLVEKTAAQGNASGATGIVVKDISFFGNGSADGGINFGNSGGTNFNSQAYLADVLVRDFDGVGVKLQANAVTSRNVWSLANGTGFYFNSGGANHWDGFWGEANTTAQVVLDASPYNTFSMLQLEDNGVVATNQLDIKSNSSQNKFFGLYMTLSGAGTNLVVVRSGAHNCEFFGVTVATNGNSFTNTIYTESGTFGTGQKTFIPFFIDQTNTTTGYIYNQSTGTSSTIVGTTFTPYNCSVSNNLDVTATTTLTGNLTAGVAGTGYIATFGQGAADNSSGTVKLRSGTTGESVLHFNQNGTDHAKLFMTSSACFFDTRSGGGITFRDGLGGTQIGKIASTGALTIGASGAAITKVLSATATLNFDLTAATVQDLTITVTGAVDGNCVVLGVPNAAITTTVQYTAWVSAADTVTVRAQTSAAGENPSSGTFRATVIQF